MNTCGECTHFIGCGDWNLCCDITHPTPKEKEMGLYFPFGHLCYEDTKACDMFNKKIEGKGEIVSKRKNPEYPSWHCFTTVKCKKCGEHYEPICYLEHICRKQNSYPIKDDDNSMEQED